MAINIPSITDLQQRIVNAFILAVNAGQTDSTKHVDPNIRNNFARGIVNAMAAGFDENNDVLNQLLAQLFPQTATDEYLELWASWFGITRLAAVEAQGNVVFTGTATTTIPAGTLIQKTDGTQYSTDAIGTIAATTISVTSITRSGTTATVTTTSDHNLATGVSVTISGADQSAYNITATITVTSTTTFTYTVSGSPTTPATGTILASFTTANVAVTAVEAGVDGNSAGGSQLTLVSPITDVDNTVFVDYSGLTLGLDLETDEALRIRLQERTANFTAPFTESGLPVFIKQAVAGVTRIWVQTATPAVGKVTIYFTRDNDTNIIPTAAQATTVKNAIIDATTGIKPANIPDSYVVVNPPTAVPVDFVFASLSPNTEAMQTAITDTLTDYFKSDSVIIETSIVANEYNSLLYSIVDADGNSPTFTLSSPSGTVAISTGELATLGTITYP